MILDTCKDGHPIIYDEDSDCIIYKDNKVPFQQIKEALESGLDKINLTETLTCTKTEGFVDFGCLTLTKTQTLNLKQKVWKLSKMYKTAGN